MDNFSQLGSNILWGNGDFFGLVADFFRANGDFFQLGIDLSWANEPTSTFLPGLYDQLFRANFFQLGFNEDVDFFGFGVDFQNPSLT